MNDLTSKKVIVKIRRVYGKDTIYPVSANGLLMVRLTGTKTFTDETMLTWKQLGYTFDVEAQTL